MTRDEEQEFLNLIESTIEKYPYLLEKVLIASSHAMHRSIVNLGKQVADMETIAVAFASMSNQKYSKKNELWATNLIISKLEKHKNSTYINWSTDLESLKQKLLKD